MEKSVIVQGYHGCFHEEAAKLYFQSDQLDIIESRTFTDLADKLSQHPASHIGIMAIENSIAGSLLQNYRIIREHHFRVIGECYLRIRHQLLCLPGQTMEDIVEVHSHPMAINQCLDFFQDYPHIKLVEKEDTALSAKNIKEHNLKGVAAIASQTAGKLYQMQTLAANIESSEHNYTRFFILQDGGQALPEAEHNKASIYIRVPHLRGSLAQVLQRIEQNHINVSKLQSYPVLGEPNEYYFHLDLEFRQWQDYQQCIHELQEVTSMIEVIGVYTKNQLL